MQIQTKQKLTVIAGKNAGKKLACPDHLLGTYNKLLNAALRGHYWPRRAVKELTDLSSSALGKKNVYVRPFKSDEYIVFLPALKATVRRTTKDWYCITALELNAQYFEATATGNRMGLYRATPADGKWSAEYVRNGRVKPENNRVVTVADAGYESAVDAATAAIPRTAKAPGMPTESVRRSCDLHYTPGEKRLGNLIRYDALISDHARPSGVHLADTMKRARQIEGVAC